MAADRCALTVYFEGPFWVGLFERWEGESYCVSKLTFGPEPRDAEVWERVLREFDRLPFSPGIPSERREEPGNPKRARREARRQMTDEEYARALEGLAGGRRISAVIVDPSAASFIEVLRRKGWRVRKAENDVLSGIRLTSDLLKAGKIVICEGCADCLREMDEYVWDLSGGGKDKVRKEHDHAMDDMRYFAATVLGERQEGVSAWAVERRR